MSAQALVLGKTLLKTPYPPKAPRALSQQTHVTQQSDPWRAVAGNPWQAVAGNPWRDVAGNPWRAPELKLLKRLIIITTAHSPPSLPYNTTKHKKPNVTQGPPRARTHA